MRLLNNKNFYFERLMQWPVKIKLLCIVLITSFLLLLSYAFYLKNGMVQLDQAKSNTNKLNEKLQIQQQELQTLIAKTTNSIKGTTLSKKVTGAISPTQLLTTLTQLAQQQGIKLQSLQLEASQNKQNYIIQPIHCIVIGNYQQLRQFTTAFMNLPFLLIIHSGNITPINSSQNLIFDFVLQRFQLPTATL